MLITAHAITATAFVIRHCTRVCTCVCTDVRILTCVSPTINARNQLASLCSRRLARSLARSLAKNLSLASLVHGISAHAGIFKRSDKNAVRNIDLRFSKIRYRILSYLTYFRKWCKILFLKDWIRIFEMRNAYQASKYFSYLRDFFLQMICNVLWSEVLDFFFFFSRKIKARED